ncbi:putative ANTH domain-containing protein [Medicago truncatula]|uniref:ENTH/ANTH/VHS superfamily protein n=2 Tax=Medicago truncatula TaxID=3880 RepID=A0A072VH04_MEDTR|nr:ENTH/ANTH/VHS superfamily protein [Medicago truncatula]RHN78140.1 putative ANTH domain-containing protein [Medicago truncatula]
MKRMRLWKRASGVLKDRYRIWVAKVSPYGPCRNPDLETLIIKATSHDEQCMDYKNVQRVFQWLRTSPLYLKPLLCGLSMRIQRTRSWVVALKGLMLTHGVYSFDLPMVQSMGRLPFDLSHFSDGHLSPEKGWVFNAFVRSYFAYLDQRSVILREEANKLQNKKGKESEEIPLIEELKNLEELQKLIDMLLQIKPKSEMSMKIVLILEAMDCVMDEILEVYGKFSKEINRVLLRVCDIGGKEEACIGLDIIRKAQLQGDKLSLYFDFCREIGVLNKSECPNILRINEEEIEELKRIKNKDEEKAIVVRNDYEQLKNGLKTTVITDQWEVFVDDVIVDVQQHVPNVTTLCVIHTNNPFVDECYSSVPYDPVQNYELPDLISL